MNKRFFALAIVITALLSACSPPDDQYDYVFTDDINFTASPLNAKIGEAVEVTLTTDISLDERSRVAERSVSDVKLGGCFGYGYETTADGEGLADPHGLCSKEVEELPSRYELLGSTEYTEQFGNAVIERGEKLMLKHSFTFTLTEPGEVAIDPVLMYMDEFFTGPKSYGGLPQTFPEITFE